jgi:hypothetical protein
MSLEKVSAFMQALGVAYFIWMGYQAPTSQQATKNFLVAALLGISLLLLLLKLFRRSPPVNEEPPLARRNKDALNAFRDHQWETVKGHHFMNELIDIDGKRFWDCTFNNVTLSFHGTAPSEFMGSCTFTGNLRFGTDFPPAMHYARLCQIFSSIPGLRVECTSTDEKGKALTPTFEIQKIMADGSKMLVLPGKSGTAPVDTVLKDSDPQLELKFVDLRTQTGSNDQVCFHLINHGKRSPAKFACIEDFKIGGYCVAFRSFPPPIAPFGNYDSIDNLYISNPDGKPCGKNIFSVFHDAWDALKNPNLYALPVPLTFTYQDDARNLFEARCDLVYYPVEHGNRVLGKDAKAIEVTNIKLRKVAAASTAVDWSK